MAKPPVDPTEPRVDPTEPPLDPAVPPVVCANDRAGIAATARIMIVDLIEPLADDLAIGSPPLPVNRRGKDRFRSGTSSHQLESERGKIAMTDRDPFAEGKRPRGS
ncbi:MULTISPECIES: hypothetical protein [unclassified Bradyrhizobium]|uniref:hypothetical protein n=1 Tax=unclassified Bradyrhizobium TaxID=2631580 RepID=UPI003512C437